MASQSFAATAGLQIAAVVAPIGGAVTGSRRNRGSPSTRRLKTPAAAFTNKAGHTLLVIDRKNLTRDCLIAALIEHPLIDDIVSASDPDMAAAKLGQTLVADAALLNLGSDAFDETILGYLRNQLAPLLSTGRIAIMTSFGDHPHLLAALRSGISGYLFSDTSVDVVGHAVHLVIRGWTVFPPLAELAAGPRFGLAVNETSVADLNLSVRQRQVLGALQMGLTNRSIGEQLGISERAIKAHVQELMRRLNVSNRTQLVAKLAGFAIRLTDERS